MASKEMHGFPTLAPDHPTDEDLSVGTPASRKDGARGSFIDALFLCWLRVDSTAGAQHFYGLAVVDSFGHRGILGHFFRGIEVPFLEQYAQVPSSSGSD
jgi:hypothetical protein